MTEKPTKADLAIDLEALLQNRPTEIGSETVETWLICALARRCIAAETDAKDQAFLLRQSYILGDRYRSRLNKVERERDAYRELAEAWESGFPVDAARAAVAELEKGNEP